MPSTKLICPHCGHGGTPETSRPPLGSYGFNYLAEGIVCREVRGYDDAGRLRLSGDFKCEGPQGTGARIECRSCWRTFPVPEGLMWAVATEEATPTMKAAVSPEALQSAAGVTEGLVESISRSLMAVLQVMRQELEEINAGQFAKLEATIDSLGPAVEEIHAVKAELATLHAEFAEQSAKASGLGSQIEELRQQLAQQEEAAKARADSLAGALEAEKGVSGQLAALVAQLQGAQDANRQRMDTQAEVIRVLHAAAQEQITRREELKAAVQRLEEIAGGLAHVRPLPEGL